LIAAWPEPLHVHPSSAAAQLVASTPHFDWPFRAFRALGRDVRDPDCSKRAQGRVAAAQLVASTPHFDWPFRAFRALGRDVRDPDCSKRAQGRVVRAVRVPQRRIRRNRVCDLEVAELPSERLPPTQLLM